MLLIEETHAVVGSKEAELEAAYRDEWMRLLGESGDARLLWYLNLAHGSSLSYRVVTITAVQDGAAWERLATRVQTGDLRQWARATDEYRHHVTGRILFELDFAPMRLDLAQVPTTPQSAEPSMYMQDNMQPFPGKVADYQDAAGSVYSAMLGTSEAQIPITIEGAYQTMPGGGVHPEVVLMQKVHDLDQLTALLTTDLPDEITKPGTWMHDALAYRDQWRSRLLRTAPWSPLQ